MKATDLMPGNLVTFKDCQYDEKPPIIKILQINVDDEAIVSIDRSEVFDEIEIDAEIEKAYKNADEIVYENGVLFGKAEMQEALRTEYEKGKADVLKDLPRWEKSNLIDTVNLSFKRIGGKAVICYHNRMIALADLKKLPGFKEEEL